MNSQLILFLLYTQKSCKSHAVTFTMSYQCGIYNLYDNICINSMAPPSSYEKTMSNEFIKIKQKSNIKFQTHKNDDLQDELFLIEEYIKCVCVCV